MSGWIDRFRLLLKQERGAFRACSLGPAMKGVPIVEMRE